MYIHYKNIFLCGIIDQIKVREGNLPAVHVKFSVAKVADS